jgi:protein-S-isoprenylcysteine O-methyltransferase Ste14
MKTPKILPPFIVLLCFLISLGLHLLLKGKIPWRHQNYFAGIIFLAGGFTLMMWARCLFKKCKTPIKPAEIPTAMVTEGPYRVTRNPMYLGFALMLLGTAFLVGTLPMFLAPLTFFLIINSAFIPYEEAKMERLFGQKYLDYKKRVRRWPTPTAGRSWRWSPGSRAKQHSPPTV